MRTILNGVISVDDNVYNAREVAVIASSMRDFNIWRNVTFNVNGIMQNRHFTVYDRDIDLTTRYRAIFGVNECNGLIFDDYTTTDRVDELLDRAEDIHFEEHIRQLIVEVCSHIRVENETI